MAKTPRNHRVPWTPADNRQLQTFARGNTPTRVMGLKLGRAPAAVQAQAGRLGVSLKPTNRSPYGRKASRG